MDYIIYQAYGSKDVINEAIYSLLSFYKATDGSLNNDIKIVIYTDDVQAIEHYFSEKQFIYRPLTKELIREWKGDIDFVHRIKIKILQDFFAEYHDANVLYVDSDTLYESDPAELFKLIGKGRFIMHTMEGMIKDRSNPILRKLFKYLYFNDIILSDQTKFRVPTKTKMWNAGVIGMNYSHADLLGKVLDFTDSLYPHFSKHIVEQFAFSYYFQTHGEIIPAELYIFHYWNIKEFRIVLATFFEHYKNKDLKFLLEKIGAMDPKNQIKSKLKFEALSSSGRFIRKLIGKQWKIELPLFGGDDDA